MEDLPPTGLGETERKLIAIFVRHGREGRAITMESLAANAGMPGHSKELTTALRRSSPPPNNWSSSAMRLRSGSAASIPSACSAAIRRGKSAMPRLRIPKS